MNLVVNMRPSTPSRIAHQCHLFAPLDRITDIFQEFAQMTVTGDQTVAVLDHHQLSVTALGVCKGNLAVRRCNDRGSGSGSNIQPLVKFSYNFV